MIKPPILRFLETAYEPYRYHRPSARPDLPRVDRLPAEREDEGLTGYVNGLRASDLEERFARKLRERQLGFVFQYDVLLPNRAYKNNVDFVVNRFPLIQPIEIYGQLHEKTRDEDEKRISELNEVFRKQGFGDVIVIWYWELETPEMAEQKIEELFL